MNRSIRLMALGMLFAALLIPRFAAADSVPVYTCSGTAPAKSTCTNGPHDQLATWVAHGSSIMSPTYYGQFVGRITSQLQWSQGALTGTRTFYCDLKTQDDYVNALNPVESPNCVGSGPYPPDCTETTPECTVKIKQVCKVTAYKSNAGSGAGPWECDAILA